MRLVYVIVLHFMLLVNVCFAQSEEAEFIKLGLVDVQSLAPSIKVDLKYSTTTNFLNEDVYGDLTKAYLYKEPAMKLVKAQQYLQKIKPGYSLLVYDAARPRECQYKMWNVVKMPEKDKEKYVADPRKGSIHNFGAAIDLTIVDGNGKVLDMGTEFDYFGDLSQPVLEKKFLKTGQLTKQQHENRVLLRKVMTKAGFEPLKDEWWHFNAFPSNVVKKRYKIIE